MKIKVQIGGALSPLIEYYGPVSNTVCPVHPEKQALPVKDK